MDRQLYAIRDHKAGEIIGGAYAISIHRHDASAVRMFGDIATAQGSAIGQHPEDYALIRLGSLTDDDHLVGQPETLLEGKLWKASQQEPDNGTRN